MNKKEHREVLSNEYHAPLKDSEVVSGSGLHPWGTNRLSKPVSLLVVLAVAIVGTYLLLSSRAATPPALPTPFFASSSFVNQQANTPSFQVDPNSATMTNGLNQLVNGISGVATGHPANVSDDHYAYPVYVVDSTIPAGQPGYTPRVPVAMTNTPTAQFHATLINLITALGGVPIPSYAQPALGTDQIIDIYDKGTDTFYEFWHFCPKNPVSVDPINGTFNLKAACQSRAAQAALIGTQATAEAGGIVQNVSRSEGYFSDRSYPGYSMWNWGTLAAKISNLTGEVTISEFQNQQINHAVGLMLPDAASRLARDFLCQKMAPKHYAQPR